MLSPVADRGGWVLNEYWVLDPYFWVLWGVHTLLSIYSEWKRGRKMVAFQKGKRSSQAQPWSLSEQG